MSDKNPRVPVSTGEGQTLYKRQLAYDQLGIDPANVEIVPMLSVQFRRIARTASTLNGWSKWTTVESVMSLLANSNEPDANKLVNAYGSVPSSYRKLLPPEAYCLAAGVPPARALELMTVVAVRQTANASAILCALLHPSVVRKTVRVALTRGGSRERRMLHQAMGFFRP
jgi:hypothetical protein